MALHRYTLKHEKLKQIICKCNECMTIYYAPYNIGYVTKFEKFSKKIVLIICYILVSSYNNIIRKY